jgi:hypothetical protein
MELTVHSILLVSAMYEITNYQDYIK